MRHLLTSWSRLRNNRQRVRRLMGAATVVLIVMTSCSSSTTAEPPPPTPPPPTTQPDPQAEVTPLPLDASVVSPPGTPQISVDPGGDGDQERAATVVYAIDGTPIAVFKDESLPDPSVAGPTESASRDAQHFVLDLRRGFVNGSLFATTSGQFASSLGTTDEERAQALFAGGLRIFTTYDPDAQALAIQARDEITPLTTSSVRDLPGSMAAVSIDPTTGAVRAMVGGSTVEEVTYNIATQPELSLGSAFDLFVLAAALEQGYVPDDTISGVGPCASQVMPELIVENLPGEPERVAALTELLASGSRCAALRLGEAVRIPRVVDTAVRLELQLDPEIDAFPSLLLGAASATPIALATTLSTIANLGLHNPPYYIERIEDSAGNLLYRHDVGTSRKLGRDTACQLTDIGVYAATRGAGRQGQIQGQPAAALSGSTELSTDAWFAGFTPHLTTVVWIGGSEPGAQVRLLDGSPLSGRSLPAQAWTQIMQGYHTELSPQLFPTCERTRAGREIKPDDS